MKRRKHLETRQKRKVSGGEILNLALVEHLVHKQRGRVKVEKSGGENKEREENGLPRQRHQLGPQRRRFFG